MLLLLLVLATYRLTRLIAVDSWPPVAKPRDRYSAAHEGGWLTYLWNCPFCVGVWAAAAVVGLTWLALQVNGPGLPVPFLWWAAAAGGVGLVYEVLDRLPDA